ncbi:hypothetical protein CHLRE_07g357876v5 [Chlamydomonas reinhardtii]|uniref:Uncharacterized protein n=1 Tax=Chlamydomonas reinhardtii TaxID=3055 RepID=A0A2K3DLS2_CHLRE|nr:uncharacterized protein CHLRE_07g357876v5 [Chlamydomonas reinhardtii]PNW81485.1 hypothetical protein CHLRE_07g357876v5 [Chlamydomonas reinhardtii]
MGGTTARYRRSRAACSLWLPSLPPPASHILPYEAGGMGALRLCMLGRTCARAQLAALRY